MANSKTNKEYTKLVEKQAPKTKKLINLFKAFITGGAICTVGQLFMNLFKCFGLEKDIVSALTAIVMVFLGAFLTGLNVYDEIGKFGGAGSAVPITGFANSIVSPAMEYKSEGFVMGVGGKMFVIAGPVLVYGISSSIIAGIFYYLFK